MVVGALDLKTVTLRPDLLWMQQPLDMTLFRITHQELYFTNATAPEKGLRMLIISPAVSFASSCWDFAEQRTEFFSSHLHSAQVKKGWS